MFKRVETTIRILQRIVEASPRRIYLVADGGRNPEERLEVERCRAEVDQFLSDYPIEIVRNYAEHNRGVYANIAGGAKWVFSREPCAIFLEDDTLPDPSFFDYCAELLDVHRSNSRVLWICGTNYLGEYAPADGSDYLFTRHMLPCGWASWADKFLRYYDGELSTVSQLDEQRVRDTYLSRRFYEFDTARIQGEYERQLHAEPFKSWDYQMALTLRVNDMLGTVPRYNLITNVGDDINATHGGTSQFETMTRRFCHIPTRTLPTPLRHPPHVAIDVKFEKRNQRIIMPPSSRVRRAAVTAFKRVFKVPVDMSTREALYRLRPGRSNQLRHGGD